MKKLTLDIVNHVHNYSRCLAYQLSSLVLFQPETVEINYYLYHAPDDPETQAVIDFFRPLMPFPFFTRCQPLNVLRNRARGRNEVAKATDSDWVWFTDTDHLFREDCLDKLHEIIDQRWGNPPKDIDMCFPAHVMVTHQPEGDELIAKMVEPAVLDVPSDLFWPYHMGVAIGGIQIATREVLNRVGYVPWMNRETAENWNFCSDKRFRYQLKTRHSINLPNICRIRHGTRGYKEIGTKL